MGLDISVYKNIERTDNESESDFFANVINDDWKFKIKNLEDGKNYKGDCVDRSISYPYGCHSRFREYLIRLIGRPDLLEDDGTIDWEKLPSDIPFYDFIDFADNQGCLDWEISAKIYADFKKWEFHAHEIMDNYYFIKYQQWTKVFKLAKDNGVVVFS